MKRLGFRRAREGKSSYQILDKFEKISPQRILGGAENKEWLNRWKEIKEETQE